MGTVAHNVLVWACAWLAPSAPRLASYGLVRLARDVVTISGVVLLDPTTGRLCRLVLNVAAPWWRASPRPCVRYSPPRTLPLLWANLR